MNRRTALYTLGMAAIGGVAAMYFPGRNGLPDLVTAAYAEGEASDVTVPDMVLGNPDASVEVIEYASFTCPHCANFHEQVFGQLKQNYIDTGKIKFVYREVYFDKFGLWAGMIARCGGDMRYFGISSMLYEEQSDWIAGGKDPMEIVANLRKIGKRAGLSDDDLDTCLNDGNVAQAMVAKFQKDSAADDINSTPSFVINGEKYSNMNYADFAAILDEKLGN